MVDGEEPRMTLDDDVQRLVDIEAIKQLRGRYSRAIDTKDWDLLAASLAEDAAAVDRRWCQRGPR